MSPPRAALLRTMIALDCLWFLPLLVGVTFGAHPTWGFVLLPGVVIVGTAVVASEARRRLWRYRKKLRPAQRRRRLRAVHGGALVCLLTAGLELGVNASPEAWLLLGVVVLGGLCILMAAHKDVEVRGRPASLQDRCA